jgi:hypothetical protein|eukprot:SAG25_NODE_439_length_7992_cov_12.738376_7_plen_39_part_00
MTVSGTLEAIIGAVATVLARMKGTGTPACEFQLGSCAV